MITQNAQLGAAATAAATNINGGTLVANAANVTLDNAGANDGPLVLGSGLTSTLAATAGNTLNVTGVVSDSVSGSPANLNIGTGIIVGSGGTTPNPELDGNGTVALTGVNTYSGNTSITGGATLQINGINAIGGTSRVRLDSGTIQYAASSTNGSTEISTKPLIFVRRGNDPHWRQQRYVGQFHRRQWHRGIDEGRQRNPYSRRGELVLRRDRQSTPARCWRPTRLDRRRARAQLPSTPGRRWAAPALSRAPPLSASARARRPAAASWRQAPAASARSPWSDSPAVR